MRGLRGTVRRRFGITDNARVASSVGSGRPNNPILETRLSFSAEFFFLLVLKRPVQLEARDLTLSLSVTTAFTLSLIDRLTENDALLLHAVAVKIIRSSSSPTHQTSARMRLCRAAQALSASLILITLSLYVSLSSWPRVITPRISRISSITKAKFANNVIGNTLVVVPVNLAHMVWVENLLCSLSQTSFDPQKIVFWALDSEVQGLLEVRGFTTYHDPSFYSVTTDENLHNDTKHFKKMMRERPKLFIDMLSTGYDLLFLDADTVFFGNPLAIQDPNVDIVFSSDSREFFNNPRKDPFKDIWRKGSRIPPVCNGIFWMKSNAKTIKIWQDMLDVFESGPRLALYRFFVFKDDQRGMDVLLNDGRAKLVEPLPGGITPEMLTGRAGANADVDVRLLDQTEVVSGHLLRNRKTLFEQNLKELKAGGGKQLAIHFNWNPKDQTKESGAREMGLWQLTDEGKCSHDAKSKDTLK